MEREREREMEKMENRYVVSVRSYLQDISAFCQCVCVRERGVGSTSYLLLPSS